jgi:hypothetical protein
VLVDDSANGCLIKEVRGMWGVDGATNAASCLRSHPESQNVTPQIMQAKHWNTGWQGFST